MREKGCEQKDYCDEIGFLRPLKYQSTGLSTPFSNLQSELYLNNFETVKNNWNMWNETDS